MTALRTGTPIVVSTNVTEAQARSVASTGSSAPSVHNTGPWLRVTADSGLDLYSDPAHHLPVAEPAGQQLLLTCGAALLHARPAIHSRSATAQATLGPSGDAQVTADCRTVATKYEVLIEHHLVAQARELVAAMPASREPAF